MYFYFIKRPPLGFFQNAIKLRLVLRIPLLILYFANIYHIF
uniref:Uncharacterized protein n=1 Tax=virus sp. ctxAI8 TaxID=2825829 RepID=A0A8S5RLZ8_9VIRU|nr:MAG TPA: hypothetical protein [virus sp. ctxAI8]